MMIEKRYLVRLDAFKKFIDMLNISKEEKEKYISVLYSEESVSKMRGGDYLPDEDSIIGFYNFIKYLCTIYEKNGLEYIKDALKYALTYKTDDSNFLDQFIRFIAITNFDNIKIEFKDAGGTLSIFARLGGLELSNIACIDYLPTENKIEFECFHNRGGLKRTKIGSLLMVEFFNYVLQNHPTATVFAKNVRRVNVDAQHFYKKMGFNIIDTNKEFRSVFIEIDPITMQECINTNKGKYPVLLFDGQEYDYKTYKSFVRDTHSKG